MSTGQAIKQRVYQDIDGLPSESFDELSHFLDFLKFKYQVQQPRKVVVLGGLGIAVFVLQDFQKGRRVCCERVRLYIPERKRRKGVGVP